MTKLSVWKWERGDVRPRAGTVAALANLFAVSESELLGGRPVSPGETTPGAGVDTGAEGLAEIVHDCKARIAAHLGTTTDKVEITVNL